MSEKNFRLDIVTPRELIFSGEVSSVYLPGSEGQLGVLPGHCPLLAMLEPGLGRYRQDGDDVPFVCGAGFVQVFADKVSVVVELALRKEDIAGNTRAIADEYAQGLEEREHQAMDAAWEVVAG